MFSVPSYPGENREHLGEFESRSVKAQHAVEGFHFLKNSHKLCRRFHQGMKAHKLMFFEMTLLYEIITS